MPRTSDAMEVAGVRLTSPERVLWAGQGTTKRALAAYYGSVAEWILPHLEARPLTLLRCPRGEGGECFVQRRVQEGFPRQIRRVRVEDEDGPAVYLAVADLAGLVALVQLGALELHTWGARRDRLDRPDRMILDLDPDPGLPFSAVAEAGLEVRRRLEAVDLASFVKTSGGKGLHVVVPLHRSHEWEEVRGFARALAEAMERDAPERFVSDAAKAERGGRIFVDYLRNGFSASAVAAYSPRARPGAPVSCPLAWEELGPDLRPDRFTVESVPERLRRAGRNPWQGYAESRQRLTRTMRDAVG